MTWLDRAIGYFSPEAGLRRARMRYAMQSISFAYEAAKTGRRTDGWITRGASANVEVGASLVKIRDRARDLVRNKPFAARAISAIVCNSVGTGIVPQARSGVAEVDELVDALFARWSRECDADGNLHFYRIQALVTRTIVESGEVLVACGTGGQWTSSLFHSNSRCWNQTFWTRPRPSRPRAAATSSTVWSSML